MSIVKTLEIAGTTLEHAAQNHKAFKIELRKAVRAWEKEFTGGLETLLDGESEVTLEQATRLKELAEALDVAGDMGVDYDLPWNAEYETVYSGRLEDFLWENKNSLAPEISAPLEDVYGLLEDSLESRCRVWYSSNC